MSATVSDYEILSIKHRKQVWATQVFKKFVNWRNIKWTIEYDWPDVKEKWPLICYALMSN